MFRWRTRRRSTRRRRREKSTVWSTVIWVGIRWVGSSNKGARAMMISRAWKFRELRRGQIYGVSLIQGQETRIWNPTTMITWNWWNGELYGFSKYARIPVTNCVREIEGGLPRDIGWGMWSGASSWKSDIGLPKKMKKNGQFIETLHISHVNAL